MVNFKVGDVVVYTGNNYTGRQIQPGVPKVVQSVSPCGEYLRVCRDDNGKIGEYPKKDFYLFQEEQDDPLPPAPESVSYLKEEGQRKLTARMYPQSVNIKIHLEYPSNVKCLGYSMEPDAALQLAHDLRRMAMEIKRKERNG